MQAEEARVNEREVSREGERELRRKRWREWKGHSNVWSGGCSISPAAPAAVGVVTFLPGLLRPTLFYKSKKQERKYFNSIAPVI